MRNPIQALIEWLDQYFSRDELTRLQLCIEEKKTLKKKLELLRNNYEMQLRKNEELSNKIQQLNKQITELEEEIKKEEDEYNKLLNEYAQLKQVYQGIGKYKYFNPETDNYDDFLYYENKYPEAIVKYRGRWIFFYGLDRQIEMTVTTFLQTNSLLLASIIDKNKLWIEDPNDFKQVKKIYDFIRKKYYWYEKDKTALYKSEFWLLPEETIYLKENYDMRVGDCDDYAHLQASMYIIAGFPEWRVRVVCGNCEYGGHATVYLYSGDRETGWKHLNSTYGTRFQRAKDWTDLPSRKEAVEGMDKIGIKSVWFSYNSKKAWHEFTTEAKESWENREEKYRHIVIESKN